MKLPSAGRYVKALREHCLSPRELDLLRVLYRYPNHTATADQVARAMKYKGFGAANRLIGLAGKKLSKSLSIKPPFANRMTPNWFSVVADCEKPGKNWVWKMHEPLARALEQFELDAEWNGAKAPGYWVIKARPDRNDFSNFLVKGHVGRWYTARLPKDWSRGDTLFVWAASPQLRVIGLAELAAPNHGHEEGHWYFKVRYLTNLFEGPSIADLRKLPALKGAMFLKSGPAGTVYPLTEAQGLLLGSLVDRVTPRQRYVKLTKNEGFAVQAQFGGGFGSAKVNKKVEQAAVKALRRHLGELGWEIRSVEADKVGYDLECRRGSQVLHVEAKGVRGVKRIFVLTAGEYKRSSEDPSFRLGIVTTALSSPVVLLLSPSQLRNRLSVNPLAYMAKVD